MAFFKLALLLLAFLFLSCSVQCKDEEDSVYKGINSFRQTRNLPPLNRMPKAYCLADEVAEEIENTPCENVHQYYPVAGPGGNLKIPNLQKHIDKCDINISTTTDGVILPVCVAKLEPTVVLSNYTHSDIYAQYLNNSKYTGAGLGSEDDWMVLVLTTNTTTGSFSAAASLNYPNTATSILALLLILLIKFSLF
ncbi:putative GPI-anchored protein [Sesbania bispinosa]|nr:putative GPI-anchored protein [Sesbania bispinosa]